MRSQPRRVEVTAEADEVFASTEPEGRQQILEAVVRFAENGAQQGRAVIPLTTCVIGLSCAPEAITVRWIRKESMRPSETALAAFPA